MNLLALIAQVNLPTELVSVVGGATVLAIGWQIRMSIALLRDVAVLQEQLHEVLKHCPVCKPKI